MIMSWLFVITNFGDKAYADSYAWPVPAYCVRTSFPSCLVTRGSRPR